MRKPSRATAAARPSLPSPRADCAPSALSAHLTGSREELDGENPGRGAGDWRGSGGYVAGIRLGQLGKRALLVERDRIGGICLNVGCVPSKALITAGKLYGRMRAAREIGLMAEGFAVDLGRLQGWKEEVVNKLTSGVRQLLKANHCETLAGRASFRSPHEVEVKGERGEFLVVADRVVIATGSRVIELPGFPVDGERVLDSTAALDLREVPPRLLVIGGGYIGIEIGTLYAKLGSKVVVVEATAGLLPGVDPELTRVVANKLRQAGVQVHLSTQARGLRERTAPSRCSSRARAAKSS